MLSRGVARAAPRHKDDNDAAGGGCSRCQCAGLPRTSLDHDAHEPAAPVLEAPQPEEVEAVEHVLVSDLAADGLSSRAGRLSAMGIGRRRALR